MNDDNEERDELIMLIQKLAEKLKLRGYSMDAIECLTMTVESIIERLHPIDVAMLIEDIRAIGE